MVVFTKRNLEKVLAGQKTQTRRLNKRGCQLGVGGIYSARCGRYSKARDYILVTRKFRQKLGDISQEDVEKEGFKTLAEFKEEWLKINGSWQPDLVIIAYEFKLQKKG